MPQVLEFADVVVRRNAKDIVEHLTWSVAGDERWVVLGPNGAGKTTVLQLAAALLYPTSGTVSILGERLGRTDVFDLRPRIGFASTALSRRIPPEESVLDVVLTAAYSVLGRWREQYEAIDERRALRVLAEWKLDHLADRSFGTLSDGEQKRVQIARAVMTDPELLMLDEPTASLDLGSREDHGDPPRRGDPDRVHPRAAHARGAGGGGGSARRHAHRGEPERDLRRRRRTRRARGALRRPRRAFPLSRPT
jgi:iron complex transport system ATP-binding protein